MNEPSTPTTEPETHARQETTVQAGGPGPVDFDRIRDDLRQAIRRWLRSDAADPEAPAENQVNEITARLEQTLADLIRTTRSRRTHEEPLSFPDRAPSATVESAPSPSPTIEEAARSFFDRNPLPMLIYDRDTYRILAVNDAAVKTYGYSREEFLNLTIKELRPPEDWPAVEAYLQKFFASPNEAQTRQSRVWRHRRRDGTVFEVEVFATPVTYQGRTASVVMVSDVSHREAQQRQLQERLAWLDRILETMPGGVVHMSKSGRVIKANGRALEALGVSAEEYYRYNLADYAGRILDENGQERPFDQFATVRCLRTGTPQGPQTVGIRRFDGRLIWVVSSAFPWLDPRTGEVEGIVVNFLDVTPLKQAEAAWRESERRFESLASVSPVGIVRTDAEGRCIYINQHWSDITGRDWAASQGYGWSEAFAHEPAGPMHERWRHDLAHGRLATYECRLLTPPDAPPKWVLVHAAAEHDSTGAITGYVGTITDISKLKHVEQTLQASEALFRSAFGSAPHGMALIDLEGRFLEINSLGLTLLGYSEKELHAHRWPDVVHPEDLPNVLRGMQRLKDGESLVFDSEFRLQHKLGHVWWGHLRATLVRDDKQQPLYYVWHLQDVTHRRVVNAEREKLFLDLQQAHERLQQISRRLVDVQETERRRLALELHDQIGQELTALNLCLERTAHQSDEATRQSIEEARSRVAHLLQSVRELSLTLRPSMLDDLGLVPTLLWYFDRFPGRHHLRVNFRHAGIGTRRFPSEIETAAYRIIQEAVTNAARHAHVDEVQVRLWADEHRLTVQVEDLGVGFDPQQVMSGSVSSGLSGMHERAVLLGGVLTIDSAPGRGTHVVAELPLRPPAQPDRRGEP